MATFLDSYINKLEKAKNNVESDVLSLLIDNESEIRAMIKQRWLLGKRTDGDIIGVYSDSDYSNGYAEQKNRMNPKAGYGNVDLVLSGDLVGRIKTVLENKKIEIISTDDKFEDILENYGADNFNITEEEETELLDGIMVEVVTNIFNEVWG